MATLAAPWWRWTHTGATRWVGGIQLSRSGTAAGVTVLVGGDAVYTITPGDDALYHTFAPGVVAAWSVSKGTLLWQRAIQSPSPDFKQAVFADGVIYLSTGGVPDLTHVCGGKPGLPAISALRASDGMLLWQTLEPAA